MARANLSPGSSSFVVVPLDGGSLSLAQASEVPRNPASTMKLLTTYAALEMLGPNYRWRTEVYASRHADPKGRLEGDLILRGGGDPSLVIERWWLLIQRIRALGIKDIGGDLVIDRSEFAPGSDAGAIDGNELRPYNVAPDALLVNFKALSLEFIPDESAHVARIVATPALEGMTLPREVPLRKGACGDWKAHLKADFSRPLSPRLRGSYRASCGQQTWQLSLLTPDQYALATFSSLWHGAGGSFHGHIRDGKVPADAILVTDQESPPLAEVIRDINKNSNNVMARQVFLTLGENTECASLEAERALGESPMSPSASDAKAESVEDSTPACRVPLGTARAAKALAAWSAASGLLMPELVIKNGSGLSRDERISAASLARLLVHAWGGTQMPNFVASLPESGIDGTMQKRPVAAGAAFVKTGRLSDVRAIAGYVFAASGRRYAIAAIINDPNAEGAQGVHDEFLNWVWRKG
jgi:serine-type D-Ala-D-Ala carboxypeptidase/endopeptidase (penicillin-binding protein 4)